MDESKKIPKESAEKILMLGLLSGSGVNLFKDEIKLSGDGVICIQATVKELVELLDVQKDIDEFQKNIEPELEKLSDRIGKKIIKILEKYAYDDEDILKDWPDKPTSFSVDFMNDITGEDEDLH